MNGSAGEEEEDMNDNIINIMNVKKEKKKIVKEKNENDLVFRQEVDTNIFKISMSTLKGGEAELATGDPIFCLKCKAAFNKFSKIDELKGID